MAEVEHLVQHDVAETFDAGDAVADLADDADVPLDRGGLRAGDLRFDFLNQVGHACHLTARRRDRCSKARLERRQAALTVPS